MPLEIARLLLGLLIAACHRRIADFIIERERSLVLAFRQRGIPLPAALSTESARNLYFGRSAPAPLPDCALASPNAPSYHRIWTFPFEHARDALARAWSC